MKKTFFILAALGMVAAASCKKAESTAVLDNSLIAFTANGLDISTKVSAVTSLDGFYATATTGSAGSESSVWNSVRFSGGPTYVADKYWPNSNPSYHFYAANSELSFDASGCKVTTDCSTDVVASYLASSNYKQTNSLTFEHILARIGNVSISATSGTLSNVSAKLTDVSTGGTYNLRTKAWTPIAGSIKALNIGSNDIYVVPGTYKISVTYTVTRGEYSETLTKEGSVTLAAGKVNAITAQTPTTSTDVNFVVTIKPWESNTANAGILQ